MASKSLADGQAGPPSWLAALGNLQSQAADLTAGQKRQIRQSLSRYFEFDILRYQPALWQQLQKTSDWQKWLELLLQFLEEQPLLAGEILDEDIQREGIVPDKITLKQLVANLEKAEAQRREIDQRVARLMRQYGLERNQVEAIVSGLIAQQAPPAGETAPKPALETVSHVLDAFAAPAAAKEARRLPAPEKQMLGDLSLQVAQAQLTALAPEATKQPPPINLKPPAAAAAATVRPLSEVRPAPDWVAASRPEQWLERVVKNLPPEAQLAILAPARASVGKQEQVLKTQPRVQSYHEKRRRWQAEGYPAEIAARLAWLNINDQALPAWQGLAEPQKETLKKILPPAAPVSPTPQRTIYERKPAPVKRTRPVAAVALGNNRRSWQEKGFPKQIALNLAKLGPAAPQAPSWQQLPAAGRKFVKKFFQPIKPLPAEISGGKEKQAHQQATFEEEKQSLLAAGYSLATAHQLARLGMARRALGHWQQLPPKVRQLSQQDVAYRHWLGIVKEIFAPPKPAAAKMPLHAPSAAAGAPLPGSPGLPLPLQGRLAGLLTDLYGPLNSPSWQEFAETTVVDIEPLRQKLPKAWQKHLQPLPRQSNLSQVARRIVSGWRNPELAKATLSNQSQGLSPFHRLLAIFRSPRQNRRLANQLAQAAKTPRWQLFRPFFSSQKRIIGQVQRHWAYRFYWARRWLPRLPRLRFLRRLIPSPVARAWRTVTGRLRRKITGWLIRRGSNWLKKQLVKTGLKKLAKTAITKIAASLIGAGTGPPGWLITAALWLKGAVGRGLRWLGSKIFGQKGLGNILASGFGIIKLPEGENYDMKKIFLVGILGAVVLPIILVLIVIITVAGAIFTSSGRGGSNNAAYFGALYQNRVTCQAAAAAPIAQRACRIEAALLQCQGGSGVPTVTEDNIDEVATCLQNAAISAGAIAAIRQGVVPINEGDTSANLQCVGFAKAAAPWLRGTHGNAKDFASHFSHKDWSQLQPGDVVVNTSGNFGHIAIVSAVIHPEVGEILVQISQADGYSGAVFTSRLPLDYFKKGSWRLLRRP